MNVRSLTELGRVLKSAIERSAKTVPTVSDDTATTELYRVQADTIRRWIRGENDPAATQLARVAKVLNVSVDSLVFDVDPRPPVDLSPAAGWSFSERQLAELLEGFRTLDQLNRRLGDTIDVVATYCAAPKGTLAALISQDAPPSNKTRVSEKSYRKDTKHSLKMQKRG